ncbi:MAG: nucleotidyltransferase domain-containing protein [Planctomycetes bacterium]|nr:nucleotidyltransferase domain-containing protein [Planctomycetota bacterium]
MAAHLRRRRAEEAAQAGLRADELRAKLPAAARLLAEAGARSVRLFGSLARGDVSVTSDVDLAVTGLPAERHFAVLGGLMELFAGPVDLVRTEDAPPSLRERIAAEGIDL